jgi:hypothetical protein
MLTDKFKAAESFEVLDFFMFTRFGEVLNDGRDQWWPYGDNAESCAATIAEVLARGRSELESAAKAWADPATFFRIATPDDIRLFATNEDGEYLDPDTLAAKCGRWYHKLRGWRPRPFTVAYALCYLAWELGRIELAKAYAHAGAVVTTHEHFKGAIRRLVSKK